jgi:hypothetical protein
MAEMVTIVVSKDGKTVQVEAHGFTGGECKDVTRGIEQALGTVTSEEHKPEFHEAVEQHRRAR